MFDIGFGTQPWLTVLDKGLLAVVLVGIPWWLNRRRTLTLLERERCLH